MSAVAYMPWIINVSAQENYLGVLDIDFDSVNVVQVLQIAIAKIRGQPCLDNTDMEEITEVIDPALVQIYIIGRLECISTAVCLTWLIVCVSVKYDYSVFIYLSLDWKT